MSELTWYFDFVSPFSYLAVHRLGELPPGAPVRYRPVLFAGLLKHWGQKGPAELPTKRRWTYRWCVWSAERVGVPFRFPAAHPFNPLDYLRLAIAAGSSPAAVRRIFDALWTTGVRADDPARFVALCEELGVEPARLRDSDVKDRLRRNTDEAVARGVFGVPTLEIGGELFWGVDAMDFAKAYVADPSLLSTDAMRRADDLPVGAARAS